LNSARLWRIGFPNVEEKWIRAIEFYKFPVVTLSDTVNADAVCTIFETLNRTGVKLSVFELLTARFWPQKINLRRLWDQAKADFPIIADFNTERSTFCRPSACCAVRPPHVTRRRARPCNSEHQRLVGPGREGRWRNRSEILRDDCGVIVSGWLPYKRSSCRWRRYSQSNGIRRRTSRRKPEEAGPLVLVLHLFPSI